MLAKPLLHARADDRCRPASRRPDGAALTGRPRRKPRHLPQNNHFQFVQTRLGMGGTHSMRIRNIDRFVILPSFFFSPLWSICLSGALLPTRIPEAPN